VTQTYKALTRERLLVAVAPDRQAEKVVRAGKRIAEGLDADWTVVYVETPALLRLSDRERNRRIDVLRLAEILGAETVTLGGHSAAQEILEYARTRSIHRIVVGRPGRRGFPERSTVRILLKTAQDVDLIVIGADDASFALEPALEERSRLHLFGETPRSVAPRWPNYLWALTITIICNGIAFLLSPAFELANIVMVYLLGAAIAGLRLGRGSAVLVSLLNVLAFDFFFVPPRLTFAVADIQYLFTFAIMLAVALLISSLTASVRLQARVAGHRERRTAMLYAMSRELSRTRETEHMARVAVEHVSAVFASQVVVLLPDAAGRLRYPTGAGMPSSFRAADLALAQEVFDHGRRVGLGSDIKSDAEALYVPLTGSKATLGTLAVLPANPRRVLLPEQLHLLETFAGQIALALERAQLAEMAEHARLTIETETLRSSLLASISHDLRTPLAVIAGSASTLVRWGDALDAPKRHALAQTIQNTALEMASLVANVLELTRLESGKVRLRGDWYAVDDLIGTVLHRLAEQLTLYPITVEVPNDLPLVEIDGTLIGQVLSNLFENAAKYTPPGTHLRIAAACEAGHLVVTLEDDGPGLPPGDPERLFDKFHRGRPESPIAGAGLGLAICRAILHVHGGSISAERRQDRGARFRFTLPLADAEAVATAAQLQSETL
jgi:two-component system sensor histidine kinase KdpD